MLDLNKDLLDRLEKIRTDRLFKGYVELKTKWLESVKNKQPRGTDQEKKAFENHMKYAEILVRVLNEFLS